MMIFKSTGFQENKVYDEEYFRQLGKYWAKKSIINLKRELEELSDS